MSEEWTDWIEHGHAKASGAERGTYVQCLCVSRWQGVWYVTGFVTQIYDWSNVRRYRVRKPRALQQLRDMIATLPAPAKEDA